MTRLTYRAVNGDKVGIIGKRGLDLNGMDHFGNARHALIRRDHMAARICQIGDSAAIARAQPQPSRDRTGRYCCACGHRARATTAPSSLHFRQGQCLAGNFGTGAKTRGGAPGGNGGNLGIPGGAGFGTGSSPLTVPSDSPSKRTIISGHKGLQNDRRSKVGMFI